MSADTIVPQSIGIGKNNNKKTQKTKVKGQRYI